MPAQLEIELPPSFKIGRRRFYRYSQIEHLKKTLIAQGMGKKPPAYVEPESGERFIPATAVRAELGLSVRTFWRRVKDADERLGERVAGPVTEGEAA
ncbi:MAG: hypothetical protein ACR652_00760 [Methylocystis sp.]|uniref:hypothetical protein n=1 Tax=Methylocystis sp. TaxID=1911079 RepID=UPI003DA24164